MKRETPQVVFEGYEPDPSIKAEPIQNGRGGGKPQPRRNGGNNSAGKNTSARRSGGKKTSGDRSSGNKSDSPWAKATGNRSRRTNNQSRSPSGNS